MAPSLYAAVILGMQAVEAAARHVTCPTAGHKLAVLHLATSLEGMLGESHMKRLHLKNLHLISDESLGSQSPRSSPHPAPYSSILLRHVMCFFVQAMMPPIISPWDTATHNSTSPTTAVIKQWHSRLTSNCYHGAMHNHHCMQDSRQGLLPPRTITGAGNPASYHPQHHQ